MPLGQLIDLGSAGFGCIYNTKCLMHGIFLIFLLILVGVSVGWMFALFIGVMSSILRDLSTKAVGGPTGLN